MINLFLSEFKRLWSRKSTIICFLLIPIVLIATSKYYLGVNKTMDITNPQYTSFFNFPVAALQEQLLLVFNGVVILFLVLSITQEVCDGSIRMVLIRRFKPEEVFVCKFIVTLITMFLYLVIYLILAYIIGFFMFEKLDNVSVFYFSKTFNGFELFLYTIKYYFLSFLTLISVASLVFFISTISKSVIIALGTSVGFILGLMAYPTIIRVFLYNSKNILKYTLLSITEIQHEGIAMMLGEDKLFINFSLLVILVYILAFFFITYVIYKKSDQLM